MFNLPAKDLKRMDELSQRFKRDSLFASDTADQQLADVFGPGLGVTNEENQLLRSAVSGSLLGDTKIPGA